MQQRCPRCSKVLAETSDDFVGTLALYCKRCKALTGSARSLPDLDCVCGTWLHNGIIETGSIVTKCRRCGVLVSLPYAKPPRRDEGELVAAMEERWQTMIAESMWKRAEMAAGLRFRVFDRDGFRCRYCGRTPSDGVTLQADHVVARANGGEDTMDNLVTSCGPCNLGKSDRPLTSELPPA